jgi:Domain of unknown function (DU1801)
MLEPMPRIASHPKGSAMAENKTKPTQVSVESYIDAIADETRRTDCAALSRLMTKVTKQPATMWGTSIVGFGSYHYKYESGREGDSCLVGFSNRKSEICLYLTADVLGQTELVSKLGKHKTGKGCLYVRRLGDIDLKVLEKLVAGAAAQKKKHYG